MFEVRVVFDRYNKLVGRRELRVALSHEGRGTPSRKEVIEALRNHLKLPESQVIIVKKLLTEYGMGRSTALIHVYDSMERAKMFEPAYILRRHGMVEEREEAKG
uniref:Small ribosomal subunit protein eS24 n=1 Tax=Thermofilum pendens TaxID=2269 RepID=A0A7C1T199_THEPE